MAKEREQLRSRAWQAILSSAFFSVESAVIIALTILLFGLGYQPFDWWQNAFWLIFGAVAEVLYLGVTITDPKAAERAVHHMLTERFDPDDIKNPVARDRVKRALEYRRLVAEAAAQHGSAMRRQIDATASELDSWIEQIYRLAQRMDDFEENPVINRDRRMVPQDLQHLQRRLRSEEDATVREELKEAIQAKQTHLESLRSLENNIKRADIQLDHTLSALGTVYTQVQLIGSKEVDSARAQRLQANIREEVLSLEDTIAALDEVHSYQSSASGR